jgi:hypothetical protein
MKKYFDLVTAVYAFLAAVVLFWAASVRIPPLESYKDFKPPSEHTKALALSARLNSIAAAFSGLSALCAFASYCAG